jgi:hypothetical protein
MVLRKRKSAAQSSSMRTIPAWLDSPPRTFRVGPAHVLWVVSPMSSFRGTVERDDNRMLRPPTLIQRRR